jgi:hypothetical protein
LIEERVRLDDIGRITAGPWAFQSQLPAAVDFVAQEFDIFAAGGLVIELDLNFVGSTERHAQRIQVDVIVTTRVFRDREVVRCGDTVPNRLRQASGRLRNPIALGRQAIILIAICAQHKVEALVLVGQGAAGVHLVY